MKFVIRDDDLNYFSTPQDIERWYADVFDKNIPVGFSTIPFVKLTSDVYTKNSNSIDAEYSIGDNKELVEYVKGNPQIEIMQHGCTHETKNNIFEYNKREGLFEDTIRGKEELEKVFRKKIRVFVPPHDSISNHGIRAIEKVGLDILRGTGSKNFLPRVSYIMPFFKMIFHRLRFPSKQHMPAYPYTISFGRHCEAYANRLGTDNEMELMKRLTYSKKKKGNFILTTHLHHFNPRRKEILKRIILAAEKLGADFVSPGDLFL